MSSSDGRRGERDRLLLALSGAEYQRILPGLEILSIPAGQVLLSGESAVNHVVLHENIV